MLDANIVTLTSTYNLTTTRPTSSIRSDSAKPLDNPRVMTVSHDIAKSGRVSSVVYIDDTLTTVVAGVASSSNVRVQLKLSYNPLEGRTDIASDIAVIYAELKEFLTPANLTKILNKEH